MKNLLFISTLFLTAFSYSQLTTESTYYESGELHTITWTSLSQDSCYYYHKDGWKVSRGVFENGQVGHGEEFDINGNVIAKFNLSREQVCTGDYKRFYPNGQQKDSSYLDSQGQQSVITYFMNGQVETESYYRDTIHVTKTYLDNSQLLSHKQYVSRNPHGIWTILYANGQLKSRTIYSHGQKNGQEEFWYYDGQLKSSISYWNGALQGPFETWYHNGQRNLQGKRKNNSEIGVYKHWYYDGQPWFEKHYNNSGELHGTFTYWQSNGVIDYECRYRNNQMIGSCLYYNEDGSLKK